MRRAIPILLALAALGAVAPAASAKTKAAPRCVVPRLTGDTLASAKKRLAADHCALGKVTDPKIPKGYKATALTVSKQSIKAGKQEKKKGTKVGLTFKAKLAKIPTPPPTPTITATTPAPAAPTLTTTYLDASALALIGETGSGIYTAYFEVNASLTYLTASESSMYLVGQPVSYTLTDQVTGGTVASFQGATTTGIGSQGCAIGYTISSDETTLTLTGEPVNPETDAAVLPACFSGTITVPYADPVSLNASFAGNSTYAAATSSQPQL